MGVEGCAVLGGTGCCNHREVRGDATLCSHNEVRDVGR